MRISKLIITLLSLAAMASAQAALPSSVGKAKQVLTVTQKVSAEGASTLNAKVAPLVNATNGFGTTVLRTDVRLPQTIGTLPTMTFTTSDTQQTVLTKATKFFGSDGHAQALANQMQVWMKANGVSFAWYSYEQTVKVRVPQVSTTATTGGGGGGGGGRPGTKYQAMLMAIDPDTAGGGGSGTSSTGGLAPAYEERLLLWTMSTDQNGRLIYGKPKLVPPKPRTLYIVYTPLTVEDGLPPDMNYPNAGTLFVQTRDENFEVVPGTDEYITHNGVFDEDTKSFPVDNPDTPDVDESLNYSDNIEYASKVNCLMTGCGTTGWPFTVQQLMDARGASLAVVEYVHKLKPAYNTEPDANGNYVPISNRLVIDKRVVTYNGCNDPTYYNKGHYGFSLRSSLTRYIVSPTGQYAPIAEKEGEAVAVDASKDRAYEGTVTVASKDISKLPSYVINPANPTSPLLVPVSSLTISDGGLAALEINGDTAPVTIYRTTGYLPTGANKLNAHVFMQCSVDSPVIKFSAGWQDTSANASVNWQQQVNRYTMGTTFTKGTAESKTVWTREDPAQSICYGTASYDGDRTITLSMSDNCAYGTTLLHGQPDTAEETGTWGWYGARYYTNPYTNQAYNYGYEENALGSLFPSACPSGMPYGQVTGEVWSVAWIGTWDGGYQSSLNSRTLTGCVNDSRTGLRIPHRDLLVYGPTAGGSSGWGQDGYSWGWTGVCPDGADRPVFTARSGTMGWDGDDSNVYYTARSCVKKPVSTWTLSW